MTSWMVVGGGMRGIMAASALAKKGHGVTLIDASPMLGGVMCSSEWEGLYVDKGCHLLDFSHTSSGMLYREILGDKVHPVEVRYASINRGLKSDGMAVPDMSLFEEDERKAAVAGFLEVVDDDTIEAETLVDALACEYGTVAGSYAAQCARKMTSYAAEELAAEAFETLPMLFRMRLGPDAEMEELKVRGAAYDKRLAASSQGDRWRFYEDVADFGHRNAYPSEKGMRGFCEAAAHYLENLGVKLELGAPIKEIASREGGVEVTTASDAELRADKCYWAIPSSMLLRTVGQDDPLAAAAKPVSIVLYTFKVVPEAVADYTYVHDYSSETLMYRGSTPGIYGGQRDSEGDTYVCAEVPVRMGDDVWSNAEEQVAQVWSELQNTGVIAEGTPYKAVKVDKAPVAFMIAGHGWAKARQQHDAVLVPFKEFVQFGGMGSFGKSAIMDSVAQDLTGYV